MHRQASVEPFDLGSHIGPDKFGFDRVDFDGLGPGKADFGKFALGKFALGKFDGGLSGVVLFGRHNLES